ncbi:MAG: hypothetical protein ACTSSH_03150 [Candidatus Heimdallarchaeota archaeon]
MSEKYRRLVSKIAADKDSRLLGKIVRIEQLIGKTIKKYKPYALILVRKTFKKDVIVPIEAEKITKVERNYVWFDISKEEFDAEVKRLRKIKTEQDIYPGDTGVYLNPATGFRVDPYNLGHKRKERKR